MRQIGEYITPGDGIRRAGVLAPLQSLSGPDFTGTLGEPAVRFVDLLSQAGVGAWQILPLGPTDTESCPYSSPSAQAGDERLPDVHLLARQRDVSSTDERNYFKKVQQDAGDPGLYFLKQKLLVTAFGNFENSGDKRRKERFRDWCTQENSWLDAFAAFSAFTDIHGTQAWQSWTPSARDRSDDALKQVRTTPEYRSSLFKQWAFHEQASALKDHASASGVGIIGDIPFYVNGNSADVWANRGLFSLDADGHPYHRAGVPPDAFSDVGQLWGNPVYKWHDPDAKSGVYKWYGERITRVLAYTHAVRIDHARALANLFVVKDQTATNALNAELVPGPGSEFLNYLEEQLGTPMPIIAEDLGDIDDTVRDLMAKHKLPGMGIPQFAPWGSGEFGDNEHNPDNATSSRVFFTGTHDNETVNQHAAKLWTWGDGGEAARHLSEYFGASGDALAHAVAEKVFMSEAGLAVVSIADVLSLGAEGRYNVPGTVHPDNWSRRYSLDDFERQVPWLAALTLQSNR